MANPKHLELLKRGVEEWNRWRLKSKIVPDLTGADLRGYNLINAKLGDAKLGDSNLQQADLTGADLTGADFCEADLSDGGFVYADLSNAALPGADLTNANLRNADLRWTTFAGASLCGAILRGADLTAAELSSADLSYSDLVGADLGYADLTGANLEGADFHSALVGHTAFAMCNLGDVRRLAEVIHSGPSTVGLDTIYLSKGKIPENFLRGCGVPESFITQMHSLVNAEDGLQFYSCFISYSTKDQEFADRLHGKMRDAHLRVWYSPEDMPGGKKLHEEIETQIRVYDKLLVILSEHSLESEWVKTELRKAFKAERESERAGKKKRKLFPVRLTDMERIKAWSCFDADSGKDLGVELREYFIPDFSHWKDHDQFEASFARLLKDLKAETTSA